MSLRTVPFNPLYNPKDIALDYLDEMYGASEVPYTLKEKGEIPNGDCIVVRVEIDEVEYDLLIAVATSADFQGRAATNEPQWRWITRDDPATGDSGVVVINMDEGIVHKIWHAPSLVPEDHRFRAPGKFFSMWANSSTYTEWVP